MGNLIRKLLIKVGGVLEVSITLGYCLVLFAIMVASGLAALFELLLFILASIFAVGGWLETGDSGIGSLPEMYGTVPDFLETHLGINISWVGLRSLIDWIPSGVILALISFTAYVHLKDLWEYLLEIVPKAENRNLDKDKDKD